MTYDVSALFEDRERAAEVVRALQMRGFGESELTVVTTPEENADAVAAWEQDALTQGHRRAGGWTGGALGAAVGGYLGLVSMVLLPALPLLILGGAAAGSVAGRLMGLGVADHQIRNAESVLRAGGALVLVQQEDAERARLACDVFSQYGVQAFTMDGASGAPSASLLASDATAPSLGTARPTWSAARSAQRVEPDRGLTDLLTARPEEHIATTSPQDARRSPAALDLNLATAPQIAEIDFMDRALAHKIVCLRSERKGLHSWEELREIPGLDATKIAELQRAARLGPVAEETATPARDARLG